MKLSNLNPRQLIALAIAGTIFVILLLHAVGMIISGPEHINDKGREIMGNVLFALLGILSAYMAQQASKDKNDPEDKPPESKP